MVGFCSSYSSMTLNLWPICQKLGGLLIKNTINGEWFMLQPQSHSLDTVQVNRRERFHNTFIQHRGLVLRNCFDSNRGVNQFIFTSPPPPAVCIIRIRGGRTPTHLRLSTLCYEIRFCWPKQCSGWMAGPTGNDTNFISCQLFWLENNNRRRSSVLWWRRSRVIKFSEWTRARVKLFDRICDSRRRRRRDGPGQGSCSLYHLLWP